jgi:hypothetical protein
MRTPKLVESALGVKTTEAMARRIDAELATAPAECRKLISKSATVQDAEVQPGQRTDTSFVTTSAMDRDNEIVEPGGVILDQYRLNPIVLFGHDQEKPIGKCLWIKPQSDGLIAKTYYLPRPAKYVGDWFPDFVFSMVHGDVLRGKSIGFLPLEFRDPSNEEVAVSPQLRQVITRSLLVEYSVVSVPSNPLALVDMVGKGLTNMDQWVTFKTIGKVKKKTPPAPRPATQKDLAEALSTIKLDVDRIAAEAVRRINERWSV